MSAARAGFLVGLCVVFAGAVSILFSSQSLRLDESQSLWQSGRAPSEILTTVAEDVHVPLYHELLRLWRVEAGDSVASARAFSRIAFLLAIPLLYLLGSYAYGRRVGVFAALLFALSPFMNWYADEIRMYTLFALFAIVNHYFFLRLMREGSGRGSAWGYFLSALAGVFTHYFFFLILLAQAIFYFLRRRSFPRGVLRRLVLSWALIALAFLPWGLYVLKLGELGNAEPALAAPSGVALASVFSQFFFGFEGDGVNAVVLSLWPLLLIFALLALRHKRALTLETEYFALATFIPILLAFFWSLVATPLFVPRYLIFALPSLYLLFAGAIALYPRPLARVVGGALVVLMLAALIFEAESPTTPVKEDYRGVAEYLAAHARPQDVVIVAPPFTLYPIEYYYRGAAGLATLPAWDQYAHGAIPAFDPATLPQEVASATAPYQDAWLILSYDQGYNAAIKQYFDTHFARTEELEFSPGLDLYEYRIRYDTPLSAS